MNRLRFPAVALCALAIVSVVAAVSPTDSRSADKVVPTANERESLTRTKSPHPHPNCPPCTITVCPLGTNIIQNGQCECRCVAHHE